MGQDWFDVGINFLRYDEGNAAKFAFGSLPWGDVATLDFTALPVRVEDALKQLDQQGWAMVNNPRPEDRLHLRARPDKGADSLGKFYNGTPVKVLERKGNWARVALADLTGWMMAKYLAFGQDMNRVRPAFPDLVGLEGLEYRDMPLYTRPDGTSPAAFRRNIYDASPYWIAGVSGEDWLYVYFYWENIGGYMKRSWFWEGNG